jgi:hypothetical protein
VLRAALAQAPRGRHLHYCHPTAKDIRRRVGTFEARLNQDPRILANRLRVKEPLDPEEERLRLSKLNAA